MVLSMEILIIFRKCVSVRPLIFIQNVDQFFFFIMKALDIGMKFLISRIEYKTGWLTTIHLSVGG